VEIHEGDDMTYTGYRTLDISQDDSVVTVSLNNPPLNLLDSALVPDLKRFVREVASDTSASVVVFESAVPESFAAHVDVNFASDPEGFYALGNDDVGFEGLTPGAPTVCPSWPSWPTWPLHRGGRPGPGSDAATVITAGRPG